MLRIIGKLNTSLLWLICHPNWNHPGMAAPRVGFLAALSSTWDGERFMVGSSRAQSPVVSRGISAQTKKV